MSRETITIAGHVFRVEPVYTEGHVVTANEASALNQVRAENLRNNFASKVKAADIPAGGDISELQSQLDEYAASYQFGLRALGGGSSAARRDPVEAEAERLVRAAIKRTLKDEGLGRTLENVDQEKLAATIERNMHSEAPFGDTGLTVMQLAAKAVEAKRLKAQTLVDTSDLGEAPAAPITEPDAVPRAKRGRRAQQEAA